MNNYRLQNKNTILLIGPSLACTGMEIILRVKFIAVMGPQKSGI